MYFRSITVRAFALPCKKKKAVLSIEAALVLPLFLMASLTLMTLISVFYVNGKIEAAINEESKFVSRAYFKEGYSEAAVKVDIESRLGEKFLNSSIFKDGKAGFDYSGTDLSYGEILVISVSYVLVPPFDLFSLLEIPMGRKLTVHSWNGYDRGLGGIYDSDGYVYMAKNGSVYHRSRECSHIRLNIKSVTGSSLKNLRNDKGEKYKRCEYCKPRKSDEKLYITSDGNRYHNTLMCRGLKRLIVRIRLKDIGDTPPCSRCAR